MSLYYYPIGKTNHTVLRRDLARLEDAQLQAAKRLETFKTAGEFICTPSTLPPVLDSITKAVLATNPCETTRSLINSLIQKLRDLAQTHDYQHTHETDNFRHITNQKRALINTLASTNDDKAPVPTLEELEAVLALSEHYVRGSVSIATHNKYRIEDMTIAENVVITWSLQNIKMTPNSNPYWNVNNGTTAPIPLAPMKISVNLTGGTMTVNSCNPDDMIHTTFHTNGAAHPHIMGDLRPCFGDFEFPIFQCLENSDIASLNMVLVSYLSHANDDDGAGRYWPDWIYRHAHRVPIDYPNYIKCTNYICNDEDDEGVHVEERDYLVALPIPFINNDDAKVKKLFAKVAIDFAIDCDGDVISFDTREITLLTHEEFYATCTRDDIASIENTAHMAWINRNIPTITTADIPNDVSLDSLVIPHLPGIHYTPSELTYPR